MSACRLGSSRLLRYEPVVRNVEPSAKRVERRYEVRSLTTFGKELLHISLNWIIKTRRLCGVFTKKPAETFIFLNARENAWIVQIVWAPIEGMGFNECMDCFSSNHNDGGLILWCASSNRTRQTLNQWDRPLRKWGLRIGIREGLLYFESFRQFFTALCYLNRDDNVIAFNVAFFSFSMNRSGTERQCSKW